MYTNKNLHKVRVWDLPTRGFHWALVACVIGLAITGTVGGNAMVWHFRFGYTVLALLLFRIVWGLVGGRWSRFGAFIYAPQSVINYLKGRGKPEHGVGHSPIGAGSVFAMLGFLVAQVGTGLLSDDEIAFAGPLQAWCFPVEHKFLRNLWPAAKLSHMATGKMRCHCPILRKNLRGNP